MFRVGLCVGVLLAALSGCGHGAPAQPGGATPTAASTAPTRAASTVSFSDDFEHGLRRWQLADAEAWRLASGREGHGSALSLVRQSDFQPPHRSPFNIALVKGVDVAGFTFDGDVRSTVKDYPHRDMAMIFGYEDPAHLYYVHFGKTTDQYSNGIFIVDGADRVKLTAATTPTNWDDGWHHVRVVRSAATGNIKVYFDDMTEPVMTTTDKTLAWGRVGVGSFDDLGDWDDVRLEGKAHTR
ncbi:MAG: hypothetical protein ACJ71Z_08125 [Aeromicrobium sp.]